MNFEYLVCMVQNSRVTFVNGEWQGTVRAESNDMRAALESCPQVWDYLNTAGADGWELAGAVNVSITHDQSASQLSSNLYLKRLR